MVGLGEKIIDPCERIHIIPSKSFVITKDGEYVATLIVGNHNLPIHDICFIPWDEKAQRVIEYYKTQCSLHSTYNFILFDDRTTNGVLLNMYDSFTKQIKDGDFIWARVRTEREFNMLKDLSSEFVRITNQDYLMQKKGNLSIIASGANQANM